MFLIYVIGVASIQIIEKIQGGSFSKLFMIAFLLTLASSLLKRRVIKKKWGRIYLCTGAIVVSYYVWFQFIRYERIQFSSRAALINILLCPFLIANLNFANFRWKKIEKLIFLYIVSNIFLFHIRYPGFLTRGNAGILQYKGASSDANLLGAIFFSFLILEFWGVTRISIVNRLLSMYLIVLNGSRNFTVCGIVVLLTDIILFYRVRRWSFAKLLVRIALVGILIYPLADYMGLLDQFVVRRFASQGLDSNGRAYMVFAFQQVVLKQATFQELLFGGPPLAERYWAIAGLTRGHSFAENSYISMLMLFGAVGCFLIFYYVVLCVRMGKGKNRAYYVVLASVLVAFISHDTILYIQGFVGLTGALAVLATDGRQSQFLSTA